MGAAKTSRLGQALEQGGLTENVRVGEGEGEGGDDIEVAVVLYSCGETRQQQVEETTLQLQLRSVCFS